MKALFMTLLLVAFFSGQLKSQNESFSVNAGLLYSVQFPNGNYIKNFYIPNIEGGVQYRILKSHFFGLKPEMGFSTHNFGLTRFSDHYTKLYLRLAPYVGLNLLADFDKGGDGRIFQSLWCGARLEFYNRFSPNAFFNAGLNLSLLKNNFYVKWSTPLFYSFPDQNLWAKPVDMDDYFYPLGNERWSITAGVQINLQKKKE